MGRPKAAATPDKKAAGEPPTTGADAPPAPARKAVAAKRAPPKAAVPKKKGAATSAPPKPKAPKAATPAKKPLGRPAKARAEPRAKGKASKAKVPAKKAASPKKATKKATVSADAPPPPVGPKPTSKPLFSPASKDLYGYWYGKWYDVEILKEPDRWAKGQHVYLIRWTKDPNLAKPGEWATNESYYPEDWIFPKEDIPPHQLPGAAKEVSKKRSAPAKAKGKTAARPAPVPAPAFGGATGAGFGVFKATDPQSTKHKYVYKWQYFDDKRSSKNNAGWHDYDVSGSDVVEEAYQSWVSNPYIDVRAVYSGHWNYMVDFNQMQQTNVDHADHTVRAIRRVRVDDESDAMDEQRSIRRQVSLQRISNQIDQVASADGEADSSAATLQRIPSHRGSQSGAAVDPAAAPADQPAIGSLVRVPSGRAGIVLTTSGAPSLPVQVQFADGETQFLDAAEVQKE